MPKSPPILTEIDGPVFVVTINRPDRRNAVDRDTADALAAAFEAFDSDDDLGVAILAGAGGNFCAGADLKAIAEGKGNRIESPIAGMESETVVEARSDSTAGKPDRAPAAMRGEIGRQPNFQDKRAPMGPTRMVLSKPVIAAVEGHAVAGGLELALWCDLRVAARNAVFGVYCRRFGVPLIDGGTVRLPRLIGHSRASDMILTGRGVGAEEAHDWGLANRLAEPGAALSEAKTLAREIAKFPQTCLRNDRASALGQWSRSERVALAAEFGFGLKTLESGETVAGATRFAEGAGRGGGTV